MKILILNKHPDDTLGGSEFQCDLIASHLASFGHDVIYGVIKPRKIDYGEKKYRIRPLARAADYLRCLKSEKPDIIYWRYNKNKLFPAVIGAKLFNVKFVFAISHVQDTQAWGWKRINRSLPLLRKIKIIFKRAKPLLVNGINHLGFFLVDGVVANNNDHCGKLSPKKQVAIHNSLGVKDVAAFGWKRPYVLWVSNIKSRKQPHLFIQLAKELDGSGVDFLMAGKVQGGGYEYLKSGSGLPENFYYLGAKSSEEVNSMIKSSLFLAHTCLPEGFPNVFIQAWVQGKPVVSLAFDPEGLIQKERLGFYSGGFEQFKTDVRKLIDDADLRRRMGEQAQKLAKQEFDPKINVRKLEEFLNSIISK